MAAIVVLTLDFEYSTIKIQLDICKMAALRSLVFLGLIFFAACEVTEEEDVLVLTTSNFDEVLQKHPKILVEFYAPWCGHCKKLAPEYAKAAAALKNTDPSVPLAKVDATEEKDIASRFQISGYPTLKWFVNGKDTEYTGGRTEEEIIQWVIKRSGPPTRTISSVEEAKNLKDSADVVVIGFFENTDSNEFKEYEQAASVIDDVIFGTTTSTEVASEYGVNAPAIVLFKNFDEGRNNFEDDFTHDAIERFVHNNELPLVIEFNQNNAPKIFGGPIDVQLLFLAEKSAEKTTEQLEIIRQLSAENKGRSLFIHVPESEERVLNYFGYKVSDLPRVILVKLDQQSGMKKYLHEGDVTKEELGTFLQQYFDGQLKAHLKSEEIPENNDGPVTVVVGKNFEQIVLESGKDVIVEFYAPWCGHCKSLAPIWEKLGEKFANVESVVVAKMDATANEVDHPDVNIRGFPTIKFFSANSKSAIDYNGARDLESFVKFIQENAEIPFEFGGSKDEL